MARQFTERANRKLDSGSVQCVFQLFDLLFFKTGFVACGRNTYLFVSVCAGSHESNYSDTAKCCHMTCFIESAPMQQSICIFCLKAYHNPERTRQGSC